jgi:hypothetical protein
MGLVENGGVILATGTPEFFDGGDHLLCKLTSGDRVWSFGIPWGTTELAMRRCGDVLEAHRSEARGIVKPFRKGPLPGH